MVIGCIDIRNIMLCVMFCVVVFVVLLLVVVFMGVDFDWLCVKMDVKLWVLCVVYIEGVVDGVYNMIDVIGGIMGLCVG